MEKEFAFTRIIGKSGESIGPAGDDSNLASSKKYEKVKNSIAAGEGCRIDGVSHIYRVPGKMLFATDTTNWLLSKL